MKSRRIVQRIESQRWVYYVQKRGWVFWRTVYGPFEVRAQALEALTLLRARDDYGGRIPWESAKLQAKPKRRSEHYPPIPAGVHVPPRPRLVTEEELT